MTRKVKKLAVWYFMFCKRLFHKAGFIVLLCMIPLLVAAVNTATKAESGVMHIGLYAPEDSDVGRDIISDLTEEESIVRYTVFESEEEARKAVENSRVNAAWIFEKNIKKILRNNTKSIVPKAIVKVYEQESNILLKLSHEKLSAKLFPYMSFETFRTFLLENADGITEEEILSYYEDAEAENRVIEIRRVDTDEEAVIDTNYLTMPIRGLLVLLVFLCGLSAVMYYLQDSEEGKYDWLPYSKRILPAFGSNLAAITMSAAAVFVSLFAAEVTTDFFRELVVMVLYIFAVCGFCLILSALFRRPGKFGAVIPVLMLITLALSPIFFNTTFLKPVRLMLPTHYYLNAVVKDSYIGYMLVYIVAVYAIAILLSKLKKGTTHK